MESFVSRKRRRVSPPVDVPPPEQASQEESTDLKLAILSSLHPDFDQTYLLDVLIASDGSVEAACHALNFKDFDEDLPRRKRAATGIQSSLPFSLAAPSATSPVKALTKRGRTLHLYAPHDIAAHTPCSIIHNFLPADQATALLQELLNEATTFPRASFKLFDNIVQSPHSACFYVNDLQEERTQKTEYLYNGSYLTDVRQLTPQLRSVKDKVRDSVNAEIQKRIEERYPGGKKLPYQSSKEWQPNAAFVNCYDGPAENVGYHTDQLTYLGPRAVIGSLSLGVAREFRVRKIVAKDDEGDDETVTSSSPRKKKDLAYGDAQGQIAIHLPHNSLLVMHAEMQEEWKHSVAAAQAIDPHPVAGNKRINITYRWYRETFHPKYTPRCRCGVATVLRCVQRKRETRGHYMWMCHVNQSPDNKKSGCSFFQWATFDDDGEPPWVWEKGKKA